jgi:type I restriction enzyme R subunit
MISTAPTTEKAFEAAIVDCLSSNGGYQLGDADNFDRELAFDRPTLLQFIQNSQPTDWERLAGIHGNTVEQKFIDRLCQELNQRGMLDVLRYGITDYGVRFKLAYFKPASGLNPETLALYLSFVTTLEEK